MAKPSGLLLLITALVLGAIFVLTQIPLRLGLDLQGGAQLTVLVKPTADIPTINQEDLQAVLRVLENRVNGLGVSEPVLQTVGSDQILVQLPGVSDPAQAERVLGGTAQMEFRPQRAGTEGQLLAERQVRGQLLQERGELLANQGSQAELEANQDALERSDEAILELFAPSDLTGKYLQDAGPQPSGQYWDLFLRFNLRGGELFAELTRSLAGTGRLLGIFLDENLIDAATVGPEYAQTGITGGSAVISGQFTLDQATDLGVQLRGGSLPLPVEVVSNRTVGATLGRDSIRRSIYAGTGGLILVLIFMVAYYRLPGLIADISLVVYALLTLAVFDLLGVTLTLPGIVGFILSIGMAVDANVLIFERTREELRMGRSLYRSIESGFYRAFSSILDSNVTTLIACAALFWLGSGLVKGFALTLAIGVMISMFTAITCSRTLMFTAIGFSNFRKPQLFCPKLQSQ